MNSKLFYTYIYIVILFFVFGCRSSFKGNKKNNQSPRTFMTVDTIARSGANRLTSQVTVRWWGTDADGYITSYKISFDRVNWYITTRQDSTFLLQLPAGKDTFDFNVYIKAVDNLGAEDPGFASLVLPVKNSRPTVQFTYPTGQPGLPTRNPVKCFPAVKFFIDANDPDGNSDLDHFELYINDTTQTAYIIPPSTADFTIVAAQPKQSISGCIIYSGSSQTALNGNINGLKLDDSNTIYIRAVDRVGSRSSISHSSSVYITKVHSDILVVNAMTGISAKISTQKFYGDALITQSKTIFDTLQITEVLNDNYTQLSADNQTQSRVFNFFKHIVWFTDDANYSLSFGQKTLPDFFKNGGNIFMSIAFSSNFDTTVSQLNYTPAKNLVPQPTGKTYRMVSGGKLTPLLANYPQLSFNGNPTLVRPFFKFDNGGNYTYDYIYNAEILITGGTSKTWISSDSTNVIARRKNILGKTDFIFTSLPFDKSNGNSNTDLFFKEALINELEF